MARAASTRKRRTFAILNAMLSRRAISPAGRWIRPAVRIVLSLLLLVFVDLCVRPEFLPRLLGSPRNLAAWFLPSALVLTAAAAGLAALVGRRPLGLVLVALAAGTLAAAQRLVYRSYGRLFDEYDLRHAITEPGHIANQLSMLTEGATLLAALAAALATAALVALWAPAPRRRVWLVPVALLAIAATTQFNYPQQLHHAFGATISAWSATVAPGRFLRSGFAAARETTCRPLAEPHWPEGLRVLLLVGESATKTHWGAYGYGRDTTPFLDRLLADGRAVLWQDAWSLGTWTRIVQPYLMAGHETFDPERDLERLPTLFHYAKCAGHRTAMISSQTLEFNGVARIVADEAVDRYIDGRTIYPEADIDVGADDMRGLEVLLREMDRDEGPWTMAWVLNGQHHPYRLHYPPEAEIWTPTAESPADPLGLVNAYDNAVRYGDDVLAALWRGLAERGRLDDTIIVWIADHGERMGEQGWFHGSVSPFELAIPAFVAWPAGLDGHAAATRMRSRAAERLYADDVVPTLAGVLGQAPHPDVTGRDLGADDFLPRTFLFTHWTLNNPPQARPVVWAIEGDTLWTWLPREEAWRRRALWAYDAVAAAAEDVPEPLRTDLPRRAALRFLEER